MIKNEMIRIQLLKKEKPINTTTDYIYNINHDNHCKQDNYCKEEKPVINIYDYVKK
tara:strand:- start:488 stop:655 length:168 start_codon:yes stop_codon:yes gene_type:complete